MFASSITQNIRIQWSLFGSIVFYFNWKQLTVLLFLSCLPSLIFCQIDLSSFKNVILTDSSRNGDEFQLIVYSSHKCGFCRQLRRDFQSIEIPDNLKVIFVERDTRIDEIIKVKESYRNSDVYIFGQNTSSEVDFFPTLYLFNTKGKRVKKWKGYRSNTWNKILRRVN